MRKIARFALFLLPILVLLPHVAQFPFQPGAQYSDLVISHMPNALYIQRALVLWKTIPLWSNTILSGYPFAANPLSGLFYPPGWLAVLLPLPLGFNLLVILHLIFGGIGMYKLLRLEGLGEVPSLLGALTFEALPKLFAHLGAGHVTLIYAVSWMPWLLWAEGGKKPHPPQPSLSVKREREGAERPRPSPSPFHGEGAGGEVAFLPGLFLGLILLADVRWAAYAGLAWAAYSLRGEIARNGFDFRLLLRWGLGRLANVLLAVLIAAPLLLPLAEYTRLSTRAALTAQDSLTLSLPPGQLFGLIFPVIGGTAEWTLYPGAVAFLLVILALAYRPARKRAAFWLGLIAVTLLFALGSYLPPLALLTRLPGLDLLRVPPRALFLTGFAFAAAAAVGLNALIEARDAAGQRDRSGLVLFAVSAFAILFAAAGAAVVTKPLARMQFAWGGAALLVGAVIIFLARARRIAPGLLAVLLLSVSLIDLSGVNGLSLDFRPVQRVAFQDQALVDFLSTHPTQKPARGYSPRSYSPSYSVSQLTAAMSGMELADGVDPLQLAAYTRFMQGATGIPNAAYSVTLPPYPTGHPESDNQATRPDPVKLGLLNVRTVISAYPLEVTGLNLLGQVDGRYIYENTLALPRAWVQEPGAPLGQQIQSRPEVSVSANTITTQAVGPGLLVLSEIAYPGWQATVDGRPAPVETVDGLLRGVRLPAGEHSVRLVYRPWTVYLGLVLAALAWMGVILLWLARRKVERRHG